MRDIVTRSLIYLLRPLTALCLRHGIRIQDFIECAKHAFVYEAKRKLANDKLQITNSRMSVMTGLQRRDLLKHDTLEPLTKSSSDFICRIIGQWQGEKRFLTSSRKPRILTNEEFHSLVTSISSDLNPATVLFELERVNAIERAPKGIKLKAESHVLGEDVFDGFRLISDDFHDLLAAAEENILDPKPLQNLHARTFYDRVRPEAVDEIKLWLLREGHNFHARARDFISQFDQDINPTANFSGKGTRIFLGTFGGSNEN